MYQLLSGCGDKMHSEGNLQKEAGYVVYDFRGVKVYHSWEAWQQAAGKVPWEEAKGSRLEPQAQNR